LQEGRVLCGSLCMLCGRSLTCRWPALTLPAHTPLKHLQQPNGTGQIASADLEGAAEDASEASGEHMQSTRNALRGTVWAAGGSVCACMLQGTYLCMSNEVHVILLANNCSPALSGLEIDISRRHCVETCTEGPQLRGEPKSPCAAAPLPSIFPWTTSLKPAVRRPEHDRAPCPNVPAFRNTPHETLAKPCLLGPPGHPCRVVPCTSTAQDQSQGCRRRLRGALALTRE
jgi:hypothetical protein